MRPRRLLALLSAGLVVGGATPADEPASGEPSELAACESARTAVGVLATGSLDDRWKVLDDVEDWLGGLSAVGEAVPCRAAVVTDLLRLMRRESDDRIVCRILDGDQAGVDPILGAFLPDALRHTSPNVRRRALDALVEDPDASMIPAIEEIWRHERRPWLRAAALRALGAAAGPRSVDEFARAARGDDPTLARPAMAALAEIRDARALQALEDVASDPNSLSSDHAIDTLLELDKGDDVDDTLLRLAANATPYLAGRIADSVADRGPEAVPWLRSFLRARGNDATDQAVAGALESIARIENPESSNVQRVTLSCGIGAEKKTRAVPLIVTHDDSYPPDHAFFAALSGGAGSARCWDAPGLVAPWDLHTRVTGDAPLEPADVFEWNGEIWYAVIGPESICWMPGSALTPQYDSPDGDPEESPTARRIVEVDVPPEELAGAAPGRLVRLGLATVFDDDDRVAALRIALDPSVREGVLTLTRIRALADGRVALAIDRWLWEKARRWETDPEIGPSIPSRNPSDPPPDDD